MPSRISRLSFYLNGSVSSSTGRGCPRHLSRTGRTRIHNRGVPVLRPCLVPNPANGTQGGPGRRHLHVRAWMNLTKDPFSPATLDPGPKGPRSRLRGETMGPFSKSLSRFTGPTGRSTNGTPPSSTCHPTPRGRCRSTVEVSRPLHGPAPPLRRRSGTRAGSEASMEAGSCTS